ncbi:MAG: ABC transporter substrate-binding protein [Aminobacterium sp.]|jgi:ABC-type transport system substrate-binding protein|uniref:ABC transporter substrate-binding protein n=1 Tax=Aminobacterium sp. TaxID=1872491 RepID=UPI001BCCD376|nr:ABC transporter substrate-binding protein [Aminobacterium sp.]MDD2206884.1 ABC transporter substrate-binding protein [Aminobacterium sp.]MDD3425430.1 ABC transporter substrate-binding protein [Aminobacterium sp.]MDD3707931.1 ABC transporter substrate-binding protein [Aminobacterium sp.]MDD4229457.1 ABC transporter substrate-binding protein [Aminobacterium sp.]MDD4550995.1 ABC transporter substrate-binding protein [Aminobacterium sp.]
MKGKKFLHLFFAAAMLLVVATAGFAATMDTFTLGLPGDAKSLDPQKAMDTMSFAVTKHINEPLVTVDGKTKKLVPVLAERWEILDDHTYKFYLKKGVKFHNGDELTAEDVVYSLKRVTTSESVFAKSKGKFIDPEGFEIIDKYTVIVRTRGPVGGWLDSMKHPYASIFCKRAVEEGGKEYFRNPVGTGPFKFKSWIKGERIELTAFEDYHGKKPNFKNFNVLVLPDDSSRVIALETGTVDMIYSVPPNDCQRLKESEKVKVVEAPGLVLTFLDMNTQKKPLNDPKVRLALEYAVNKEAYNAVVYQGTSSIPNGPLLSACTFSPENVKTYPYNLEKAKELLKEAGYPDGMTLELWVSNFQDQVNGATVIQSMLAQIGIKVNIQVFESAVFDDHVKKHTHDLLISRWGMQTNRDAGQYWLPLFHSSNVNSSNWTLLSDKELDTYIDTANITIDTEKRTELFQKAWDRLDVLHPVVVLAVPHELYGARKDLVGVEDLYDGRLNYLGNLSLAD